uniref:Stefin A3 n=1 Tax=Rattus norvegicus TaxID=10116 RepID=A0ABK0LUE1_RAT
YTSEPQNHKRRLAPSEDTHVKRQLEEKTNEKYEKFKVVEYKSQVVAGQILFMKVDVGNGRFLHMKVLRGLSGDDDLKLLDYQTNKTKNDELTDF